MIKKRYKIKVHHRNQKNHSSDNWKAAKKTRWRRSGMSDEIPTEASGWRFYAINSLEPHQLQQVHP
jgi:hypothetical protein